jgi:hypothetical protein
LLADYRRRRAASLVARLEKAIESGELPPDADAQMLGDCYATLLHGLSVQARDGDSTRADVQSVEDVRRRYPQEHGRPHHLRNDRLRTLHTKLHRLSNFAAR